MTKWLKKMSGLFYVIRRVLKTYIWENISATGATLGSNRTSFDGPPVNTYQFSYNPNRNISIAIQMQLLQVL